MSSAGEPSGAQIGWAIAGAIPFLLSIALLGFAISRQVLVLFASGWLLLQLFGYGSTLKMAKGDSAHYLVKAQVLVHWMALTLFIAMLVKVS